ncbi:MAG: tetratricopeptide repeat protein, partial [Planctomycetota bacterium]
MNLTGWRFLVFALASAAGIILLASIGLPGRRRLDVDRHTGEKLFVVRTAADAFHEARRTGSAAPALETLKSRLEQFDDDPILVRLKLILEAELSDWGTPVPDGHPEIALIRAEEEKARKARRNLDLRVRRRLTKESLLALLVDLEADETRAQVLEGYFEPLAHWTPVQPPGPHRPDEMAVRALARLNASDAAEPTTAELFHEVARAYRSQNRPRARLRWLLRAFGVLPDAPEARDPLIAVYLEHGRLKEALLVVGSALRSAPENRGLWKERARIAGWLGLGLEEAEAREVLVAQEEDLESRRRLITLYDSIGAIEKAIPHARVLTRDATDPKELEWPARLALEAGDPDLALEIIEERATGAEDPTFWRERIVAYAWQDMRVDRVMEQLEILRKLHPEADYEKRLEAVYRRTNEAERLAALLEERLQLDPDNEALEREIMSIRAGLGQYDKIKELQLQRIDRRNDPLEFFDKLATYIALEIDGLEERGHRMVASEKLGPEHVARVLDRLRPLLEEKGWNAIADALARRFVSEPTARDFLVEQLDRMPDDQQRALAAERLALDFPSDMALLQVWVERASWGGELDSEIRSRERWLTHRPGDLENRRGLADLYAAAHRDDDAALQWRYLALKEGIGSASALRYIDALFATGEVEEAMAWLQRRASLPGTTLEERLDVADQLFGTEHYDRALRFYMAVLDERLEHPHALLRVGQIRSWTNDPRGAIPWYERRLEATDENAGEVRFYLGEALWAVRRNSDARTQQELALEDLEAIEERTADQEVMVAKIYSRFGRGDEAVPIFEQVLLREPDNVDLVLDYADAMMADKDARRARELVERARRTGRRRVRTMRTDGKVAILEGRYEEGATILAESLERYGPEAGTESELARAHELAGNWKSARDAYKRSLALQPDNRDVEHALLRLVDRTAKTIHGFGYYRSPGTDQVWGLGGVGTGLLGEGRWRLAGAVDVTSYTGRAQAVDAGATDLESTVLGADLTALYRFNRQSLVGGGINAYPGAPGDAPVGGWLGVLWRTPEPYRYVGARAHFHTLFVDPAAAVSLGGRSSGLLLSAQGDLGRRFWGGVELGYEWLTVDDP